MARHIEQYQDEIGRLYRDHPLALAGKQLVHNITFQVTDACNLRCSYCYQINKGTHVMSMDVAKRFIDLILDPDPDTAEYINSRESIACVIEFIGGEPFLEIDLIDEITDYFFEQMIIRDHPWQYNHMISLCSNGVLYFDPKVQAYMKKHERHLSFNISIDGNKQLHDSCRVFPDGTGSYDIAMAGVKHWTETLGRQMGSKMTLAPANIKYTKDAVVGLIDSGYDDINLNCVFEKGWTEEHATILYHQLVDLANYLLENDLEDKIDLSIFVENFFKPKSPDDTQTWCWGAGTPILTSTGYKPIETLQIGDLVYTADGTIHPIVDTKSHFADNCVILKTSGAYDMVCTDNHKLFGEPFDYLGNKNTKHYKPYGKYEVKDLVNNSRDKIELFRLPKGNIHVDENIAYLVGRYVGDGWDDANRLGHTICCAYNEQDKLLEYFKKANVLYSLSPNKTVQQIRILYKGTELANNMLLHGYLDEAGHLATGKKVPYQVFSWDESSIRAFLQGYYDADGSKHSTGQIRCNSVSVDLMNGISLLLRTLGYNPVCNINKRGGTSTILGREVNIHDRYEMAYYEDATRSRYVMIDNNGKAWTAHNSITIAEPQMVYNITVDKNHSYIAGGLVSSNCGGYGKMISVDYKGDIYPCIRYMESSLGTDVPPVIIGNVYEGIMARQEWKDCVHCMRAITRLTEFSQECLECPIAEGCAECAAYNYQDSGGCWNKRATYICIMHKARALANCYYWNMKYWKNGELKRFKLWLSDEEALKIISQEELDNLKLLQFPLE